MDRFTRGLVSGMAGGLVMNAWSFIAFSLNIMHLRYLDWAGVILLGRLPSNVLETLFSLVIHIFWVGGLGVIFAFLLKAVTTRYDLLKGIVYAVLVGFLTHVVPELFRHPYISGTSFDTVVSNFIGGALWGLTLAAGLRWLDTGTLK